MITTNSKVNNNYLQQIQELYPQLQYIEAKDTIYFVGKDLELIKGKAGDHFYRSYQNYSKNNKHRAQQYTIAPQLLILEKATLKSFKEKYQSKYNISLGAINRLIVVNLSAAHFYLGLPLETNNISSIIDTKEAELLVKEVLDISTIKNKKKKKYKSNSHSHSHSTSIPTSNSLSVLPNISIANEQEITKELSNLSSFTAYPYRRETTVLNKLKDQPANTRRYDLYRELPNSIEVIEIKKNPLSTEDIAITLGDKGYLHLLPQTVKTINFIFIAPSILPSAIRLLDHIVDHITYKTVEEHIRDLLIEIKESIPTQGRWYLKEIIKEITVIKNQQFEDLV